ncbi:FAD-dependent oxidoreductase [Xanthomonas translucens pv. arrhenatheri]|uniref:FAD-binding monooxygenase n=1 Tax=Xanthomonas graminis pv. arrhenatheri LMG 727 TaxID=1195923 RepID=A0A0K2ZKD2_9XANT|nr:FAD-dependent oxidoreductase [Xanthomonas translucens]OAX65025.1 FAD-dependent oxidoreductase [Xanthomonas translucens pv. arrhenatheri]UKE78253.1 FAD-dependent oxidoreductase [Xanthomonas translucens pv. arrhenatheri]CTP85402.1 FAD-binding monooxygenase [Xanthomonas translucens pv. arrhenatheri LMG 727]
MVEVLIVGAGPTGLTLALWLARQGVSVRLIDKSAGPGETSRAMAVQARTLELYRQVGIADAVVAAGHRTPAMNLWARGKRRARIALQDSAAGLSPYPFVLVYPQDQHERLLIAELQALGVVVERTTELLCFEDRGDRVAARLRLPDGSEQAAQARYLAACDGARSPVRHQLGIGFEGGTYKQVFYVADVELGGLPSMDEAHIALGDGDFILVLAYSKRGHYRLIGTVRDARAERAENLTFADVSQDAIGNLGVRIEQVNWFSTYRVHHRVADSFRSGHVFLLGDAAHVHSPVGGQGMNTGILDAINLSWKLADVLKGRASDTVLDSYAAERQAFARTLIATTDRAFTLITAEGSVASFVRTYLAPTLASLAYRLRNVSELMFRTVSQTMLHYRDSPLSAGKAGAVAGGDRLPWVRTEDTDNYAALPQIGWQLHVYGSAPPALQAWCDARDIALRVFAWQPGHQAAGFAQDAAYLVRPDGYVACAAADASRAALDAYRVSRGYRQH